MQSNIRAVECSVNSNPVFFINDEYVNLKNSVLTVNKDYSLDSDYVIRFSGYNLSNGLIMQIGKNIKIYLVTTGNISYLELYSPISKTNYYCQSNRLVDLSPTDEVEVVVVKDRGIFNISFNRK